MNQSNKKVRIISNGVGQEIQLCPVCKPGEGYMEPVLPGWKETERICTTCGTNLIVRE